MTHIVVLGVLVLGTVQLARTAVLSRSGRMRLGQIGLIATWARRNEETWRKAHEDVWHFFAIGALVSSFNALALALLAATSPRGTSLTVFALLLLAVSAIVQIGLNLVAGKAAAEIRRRRQVEEANALMRDPREAERGDAQG